MERIALAIWRNRISPLFDVAKRLLILDLENGVPSDDAEDLLFNKSLAGKVSRLCDLNIDTLICGAVSKELSRLLTSHGIEVIAFVAGDKDDILSVYLENGRVPSSFYMPGCGGAGLKGRRRKGRRRPSPHSPGYGAGHSKGAINGKNKSQWTPDR